MSYALHMLNQRPRRTPTVLPILYAEDARVGVKVRLLFSTAERIQPIFTLLERLPENLWRVAYETGDSETVHVSVLASLPLK